MNGPLQQRSRIARLTFGNWLAIALAALSIVFIVQNRDRVSIDLFFLSARLPLWISLALVFLAGWLSGRFSRGIRERR